MYENALSQKKYFSLLGYPVTLEEARRGEAFFYRVLIGQFADRQTAAKFAEAFKSRFGIEYRIVQEEPKGHD